MASDKKVAQLECLLAAIALKHGGGLLELTNEEIEATLGHGFEMSYDLPGGGVRLRAMSPEALAERALPAITHPQPPMAQ